MPQSVRGKGHDLSMVRIKLILFSAGVLSLSKLHVALMMDFKEDKATLIFFLKKAFQ